MFPLEDQEFTSDDSFISVSPFLRASGEGYRQVVDVYEKSIRYSNYFRKPILTANG